MTMKSVQLSRYYREEVYSVAEVTLYTKPTLALVHREQNVETWFGPLSVIMSDKHQDACPFGTNKTPTTRY
jgi:hypothetical protein